MKLVPDAFEYLMEVDHAANTSVLWEKLSEKLYSLGVSRIFYRHIPLIEGDSFNLQNIKTHGYPDETVKRYGDEGFFESDIIQALAFAQDRSFFWLSSQAVLEMSERQKLFLEMLGCHGSARSLVIPVFGSCGRTGYFCLFIDPVRVDSTGPIEHICQVLCSYTHVKYTHLSIHEYPKMDKLSKRELEIIRWVARGNSNSAIGKIMGISRHTVDSYLRRIFLKLGTTDRTTAALKALNMGMITL